MTAKRYSIFATHRLAGCPASALAVLGLGSSSGLILGLGLCLSLCSLGPAQAAPAARSVKAESGASVEPCKTGLLLRQRATYGNVYVVRLVPDAIRIDHVSGDFHVISKAPDWTVYVIRPRQRTMSVVSHKDWCEKYNLREGAWPSLLEAPLKVSSTVYKDRPGRVYWFGQTQSTNISENLFQSRVGSSVERRLKGSNHAEITYIDYSHSSESGPIIGRLQNLPNLQGIPVLAQRKFDDGRNNDALFTTAIQNVAVKSSIFQIPTGFQKVEFNSHMVATQAQLDNATDLFKELLTK